MQRVLVSMIAILVLAAAPPAAAVAGKRVAAPAPCGAGLNCWWSNTGYTGHQITWRGQSAPGSCAATPGHQIRSYAFYGGQEGYFYPSTNCTGPSRPALYNTESSDLGFIARSFKAACVSCLVSEQIGERP